MIGCTDWRNEGETKKKLNECERTAWEALEDFVVHYLSLGCLVSGLSKTTITVETDFDESGQSGMTTIIEGTEEDMEFIVKVAAHHVVLTSKDPLLNERANEILMSLITKTSPLEAMHGSFLNAAQMMNTEMLIYEILTSIAILYSVDIREMGLVRTLLSIPLEKLVSAIKLSRETAKSLIEIVREQNLASI